MALFSRSRARTFRAPPGQRIYAIGDVHGRLDLLEDLLDRVSEDDRSRGGSATALIFLGDLIDRGPDSAGVVRRVRRLCTEAGVARLIKGNHEDIFVSAASGNAKAARALVGIGGLPTLLSYGITREEAEAGRFEDLARMLHDRIPPEDVAFLDGGEDMIVLGDYVFVHAGIRPGVPLDMQEPSDLRWIRTPFLTHRKDHCAMIVHGHTVSRGIDEQRNRIGIDTGGYATGVLTAIGLQDEERWYLQTGGAPLENGTGEPE